MEIFSNRNYSALKQNKIEALINSNELQRAYSELNNLPSGLNADEKLERLVALNEGYKVIISKFIESYDKSFDELRNELSEYQTAEISDEDIKSGKVRSVEDIKEAVILLKQFEEVGLSSDKLLNGEKNTPAYIKDELDSLKEYEELGSIEDITEEIRNYEELKYKINKL
ncbi:MAG: hypothetical protein WC781_00185 [Candidatus Pacearchaeota archaeon]|jgi:hypothetical protein